MVPRLTVETIVVERDGAVATVRLNRPQVLNALNLQMLDELAGAFAQLDTDEAVRAVIVTDLERIGDYAVDIAKNAIKLADVAVRPASVEVGRIANMAYEMLQDAMRAYREGDAALADDVIERDDDVDVLYRSGIQALQAEMQQDPGTVPAGTLLLFVVSIIERVGDRAQNIAWHTKDIYS